MASPGTSLEWPPQAPNRNLNFMNFDGVGMSLIPACSWHRAQKSPGNRIGLHPVVVEESAIEWNSARVLPKTPSTEDSDFLSFHAIGTYLIPL